MKKYSYLPAAFVLLTLGACKKSYTCQCMSSANFNIPKQIDARIDAKSESEAEAACLNWNYVDDGPTGCHLVK